MATIKNHVLVNGSKIGKATVVSNALLKKGSCIQGTTINPTSVTFHQTACIDVDAPRMALALKNANNDPYAGTSKSNYRKASWTITVGYNKIVQNVPLNWRALAQGTTAGNNTSISIEMCMYTDKTKQYDTYLNAIALFKVLLKEYKSTLLPKAHYDWSKKNCPQWLREGKYGYTWSWFKGKLTEKESVQTPSSGSTDIIDCEDFTVRVTVDALNIRKGAGTNYGIVGTIRDKGTYTIVKTNKEKTWGYLKSGEGWISIDAKYVVQVSASASSGITNSNFMVRVIVDALNIRKGAGTNYGIVGTIRDKGTYTIVKTNKEKTWGYLKSGEGWISIDAKYVKYL